jgi:toxin ParE1/3/4
MARLIWTSRCLDDLERLIKFIETDAPVAACLFAQRIIDRVEMLQLHPSAGSLVLEDESRTYRQVLQGNYRIIYRVAGDAVYLVAIHHASRLLKADELE